MDAFIDSIKRETGDSDRMMIESMQIESLRKAKRVKKKKSHKNLYPTEFNTATTTMTQYRKVNMCAYCFRSYNTPNSPKYYFQFHHMWDPYTGEKLDKDPYGPLTFCPECIAQSIHHQIPNANLYIPPNGEFQERYGDALGAGQDFHEVERGNHHPEWNIFRVSMPTLYLAPNSDLMITTVGPLLTMEEIKQIDMHLHQQHPSMAFSLVKLKQLYDISVSPFTVPIQLQGNPEYAEQHQKEYTAKTNAAKTLYKMKWR
jgi:hypothetical protein